MSLISGFDATQVEPASFDTIPAGKYPVCIVGHEEKPNKKGTGEILVFKLQIIDGQFKNRVLFTQLNLKHENPQCVQIARADLSAICRATNVLKPKDPAELHNIPFMCNVKVRHDDNGNPQNDVKGFFKKDSAASGAPPRPAPAPGGGMPWKRQS